jgi:uncharacterized protein
VLPSNLLRARVTRKSLFPLYVSPEEYAPLAQKLIDSYKECVGMKKGVLLEKIALIEEKEDTTADYKLVRGLSTLLERSCAFEVHSAMDPRLARRAVFELASQRTAATAEQVKSVLVDTSSLLSLQEAELEVSLWADLDDELFLKEFFPPPSPEDLIKRYNLSLAQTSLFKCSRMEFTASGNWKNIFRSLKWLGLMYSIEKFGSSPSSVRAVSLDGPMSLFKMTDRYGVAVAKLLPAIVESDSWTIKAELVDRKKSRILSFEESSEHLRGLVVMSTTPEEKQTPFQFDSSVEEKFARKFIALKTGWILKREPEPLVISEEQAGKQSVIIPDFSFEMPETQKEDGMGEEKGAKKRKRVYLEIVGFWTQEYMQRKLAKLSSLLQNNDHHDGGIDLLVAADESLLCSHKLVQLAMLTNHKDRVILYKNGNVPLQPIVNHLKSLERVTVEEQIDKLLKTRIDLVGDVVSIEDVARNHHVSLEAARSAMNSMSFPGYLRVGDYYLNQPKADEVKARIEQLLLATDLRERTGATKNNSTSAASLSDAVALIESLELPTSPNQLLEVLGYAIVWDGLDYVKSRVVRGKEMISSTPTA